MINFKHLFAKLVETSPPLIGNVLETLLLIKNKSFSQPPKYIRKWIFQKYLLQCHIIYESGTYLGKSTVIFAKAGASVISTEPNLALFRRAQQKFKKKANVNILNNKSEDVLDDVLSAIDGSPSVGFWLDGHFSDDNVALDTGDAPLISELTQIIKHHDQFKSTTILIDDVRYMTNLMKRNYGYPDLNEIISILIHAGYEIYIHFNILIARRVK